MSYIVTISRDGIDKGDPNPIRAEDTTTGVVLTYDYLALLSHNGGHPVVRYSETGRQDGARVWIECDDIVGTRHTP